MQPSFALSKRPSALYRMLGDRVFAAVVTVLAFGVVALSLGLGYYLYLGGSQAIERFGFLGFLTGTTWDPALKEEFGAWPYLVGTLLTSFFALLLSLFPALAAAIYAAEYAPKWIVGVINYLVDLMAAVPSVIYGIWGIFVLAPFLREKLFLPTYMWAAENAPGILPYLGNPSGYGFFTAVVILASMIIPYTTALARDAIGLVPQAQREAAYALGATRWEVMRLAMLPYARGGILAGIILALGRALGETMAVAMVIGNTNIMLGLLGIPLLYPLFGPATTMPSVIALEFKEAVTDIHLSSLIALGFYLFLVAFAVNSLASYLINFLKVGGQRA
jgi:phosphate transport system permease protein